MKPKMPQSDVEPARCSRCGGALGASGNCGPCLYQTTFGESEASPLADEAQVPWTRFSGLDLHEEIGRGGMGVVYRARQAALDRIVAVKVLLRARFAGNEERVRFYREAQAAARLQHPGIVGILDVGETEGVPWFSMDHLAGGNLEDLVREHPLPAKEAAMFVRKVADAVGHAHSHGVLHRDLKPSNILLDEDREPKVTDFGIARLAHTGIQAAGFTRTGQLLGSPGYAAPEQAFSGESDARTDVHGLGALLYHLLTGRPPFQGPTPEAILIQLREDDPMPPGRLVPGIPADLATICLKCLRKLPANRYQSAREVAQDLERFLDGKPILARPLGWLGRTRHWARRNPALATLLTAVALLLVGIVATVLGFARHQAQMERRTSLISEAHLLRQSRLAGSRTEALDKLVTAWRIEPSQAIRAEAAACLTLPEIGECMRETLPAPDAGLCGDGKRIARVEGADLVVRSTRDQREIFRLPGLAAGSEFKLDDHGERLAHHAPGNGDLVIVSIESGQVVATYEHPGQIHSLDWSGELIATACENRFIYIWDVAGGLKHRLSGHEASLIRVAFRPHSQELASSSADSHIRLWHAARGTEILRSEIQHHPHQRLWWSASGETLHGLLDDGSCESFPVSPSPIVEVLAPPQEEPHSENLGTADLSSDGRFAVVVDENSARLWDFDSGRTVHVFPKQPGQWLGAKFSPDGSRLWTCGWDNPLEEWELETQDGVLRVSSVHRNPESRGDLIRAVSADGRLLVFSNNSAGWFIVADIEKKTELYLSHPGTLAIAISPDGKWLLTSSHETPGVKVWSTVDGTLATTLMDRESVIQILTLGEHGFLLRTHESSFVFRPGTWKLERELHLPEPVNSITCTANGTRLAVQNDNGVLLLDTTGLGEVHRLTAPAHAGWLGEGHLVFNRDGSMLLLHTAVGTVIRWDLAKLNVTLRKLGMDWHD